jgi:hypothetical protein
MAKYAIHSGPGETHLHTSEEETIQDAIQAMEVVGIYKVWYVKTSEGVLVAVRHITSISQTE